MCLLCEPAEFTHLAQSELRGSTKRWREKIYKEQTDQACSPSTCTASVNFVERTIHGTDLITPPLCQEGQCRRMRTQSSIPVSDADFPYSFGQVSQGRNPGHMEMNDKTLIDMRAGFHLNLLALELLIFHLKPFISSFFFFPSHLCYKLSMSVCTISRIGRSRSQVGPLSVPVMQMTDSNKWEARALDLNGNRWRIRGQRISLDKITAPRSIVKLSNVLQTCRIFL